MQMKLAIHKFCIGLLMYVCGWAFGITFDQLTPEQKQIHAILYKIVQLETKKTENRFAVALEIVTKCENSKKSHVFLLHGAGTISFSSVSVPKQEQDKKTFTGRIEGTHKKLCGEECQSLDVRLKTDCTKHDKVNEGCSDPECYFYRKSLLDSEFTCINFLENPEQKVVGLLKVYQKKHNIGRIIEINFHGFSARDTYLACFCHLSLYCEKANQAFNSEGIKGIPEKNLNFWQKLKLDLFPAITNPTIPVRFYISSKIKYDSAEYFKNDKKREEGNGKTIEGVDAHLDSLQKVRAELEEKVKEDSVNFMNMFVIRETLSEDCKSDGSANSKSKFKLQLVHDENLCEMFKEYIHKKIGEMSFEKAFNGWKTSETSVIELPICSEITDGATSSSVSLATGISPSTPEDQETILTELAAAGYRIQDVPGDGNCGIWAVLVAAGEITPEELQALMKAYNEAQTQYCIGVNWRDCKEILKEKAKEAVEKMESFRKTHNLGNPGDWIDNINDLPKISEALGRPIVLITIFEGHTTYSLYNRTELALLYGQTIKGIRENNSDAIFIYFDGVNHYQAIVPQGNS